MQKLPIFQANLDKKSRSHEGEVLEGKVFPASLYESLDNADEGHIQVTYDATKPKFLARHDPLLSPAPDFVSQEHCAEAGTQNQIGC